MVAEKTVVRLVVASSSSSADELERRIGMKPDRRWEKGDARSRTRIVEPQSGWMIAEEETGTVEVSEMVERLLGRVAFVAKNFAQLDDCFRQLSVVIYCSSPPALGLSAKAISKIAGLELSMDIDLYLTEEPSSITSAHSEPGK